MGFSNWLSNLSGSSESADITSEVLDDGKMQFSIIPHNVNHPEVVNIILNEDGTLHSIVDEDGTYADRETFIAPYQRLDVTNTVPGMTFEPRMGWDEPVNYTPEALATEITERNNLADRPFTKFEDPTTGTAIHLETRALEQDDGTSVEAWRISLTHVQDNGSVTNISINPFDNIAFVSEDQAYGEPQRRNDGQAGTRVESESYTVGDDLADRPKIEL